jgi:23S rRNA pseudouridine1911/1915/1917 synthase
LDPRDLIVIHEDNHLLAVVKPANVLVQGDRTGDATLLDAARAYLKKKYAKPGNVYIGLVHRLDRPVSGVVLLARTSKAASRLSAQFRDGTVSKTYVAVTEGAPAVDAGELEHHLAGQGDAHGVTRAEAAPFPGSKPARLRFRVLDRRPDRALLEIDLMTGRRHQIRAQLTLAGCPVWGDVKYGAARRTSPAGIALHARRLEVAHPVGGAPVVLAAAPPPDWPWPEHGGAP